jgi:hypothetical protein
MQAFGGYLETWRFRGIYLDSKYRTCFLCMAMTFVNPFNLIP